jgi:hypothetical protein
MAAKFKIYIDDAAVSQFFLHLPENVTKEVKRAIKSDIAIARTELVSNLSGRVLNSRTGHLAGSVTERIRSGRTFVFGMAGTRVYYGRIWESGFNHKTKAGKITAQAPRHWALPVRKIMNDKIVKNINDAIEKAMK